MLPRRPPSLLNPFVEGDVVIDVARATLPWVGQLRLVVVIVDRAYGWGVRCPNLPPMHNRRWGGLRLELEGVEPGDIWLWGLGIH